MNTIVIIVSALVLLAVGSQGQDYFDDDISDSNFNRRASNRNNNFRRGYPNFNALAQAAAGANAFDRENSFRRNSDRANVAAGLNSFDYGPNYRRADLTSAQEAARANAFANSINNNQNLRRRNNFNNNYRL